MYLGSVCGGPVFLLSWRKTIETKNRATRDVCKSRLSESTLTSMFQNNRPSHPNDDLQKARETYNGILEKGKQLGLEETGVIDSTYLMDSKTKQGTFRGRQLLVTPWCCKRINTPAKQYTVVFT